MFVFVIITAQAQLVIDVFHDTTDKFASQFRYWGSVWQTNVILWSNLMLHHISYKSTVLALINTSLIFDPTSVVFVLWRVFFKVQVFLCRVYWEFFKIDWGNCRGGNKNLQWTTHHYVIFFRRGIWPNSWHLSQLKSRYNLS